MFCALCLTDHMRDESCEQAAREQRARQYHYYTLEPGRVITLGGNPVCTVGHIRGRPADTDDLAHRIVRALNTLGPYPVSDT